jgi:WD40 repeat protein
MRALWACVLISCSGSAAPIAAPTAKSKLFAPCPGVESLLAEGRLDRAARALSTCGRSGFAGSVRVLSQLGRDDEALAVAAKIDALADATDDERAAVAELRARPHVKIEGRSLLAAGLVAKSAGELPAARRLFDRAAVAIERAASAVRKVDARNGLSGPSRAVRFTKEGTLVVAHGALISFFTALRESKVLRGHDANIGAIAISPEGNRLITAAGDRTVRLWELPSGKALQTIVLASDPTSVAFGDGLFAIGLSDRTVRIHRADGTLLRVLSSHTGAVTAVAFAPDRMLASASIDRTVRITNPTTGDTVRVIAATTTPLSIAFSPNGKLLAIGGADPAVKVLDATNGWPLATLVGHAEQVLDVAFSRDGGTLATASADETVRLWDVGGAYVCKKTLEGHLASVSGVAFDPSGEHVASASDDRTVTIWDEKSGSSLATLGAHADGATAVSISHESIAWGSRDGAVRILRKSGLSTIRGHVTAVLSVAFSPDGTLLASGGDDDAVRVIRDDVSTKIGSHKGSVTTVAFTPDGAITSAARDGTIRTWDPKQVLRHGKSVESLAWSTDGAHLASGGIDGTIRIWNGTNSSTIRHYGEPILALAFRDATTFASGSLDGSIAIFFLNGTRQALLEGHADGVTGLAWSRGLLASSSLDGSALLWSSLQGGAPLPLDHDGDDEVTGVAFAESGAFLATASGDGAVRIFRRDGKPLLSARGLRDGRGYLFTPSGHYESLGGGSPPLRCAVGPDLYPIELCEDRFAEDRLLERILAGECP